MSIRVRDGDLRIRAVDGDIAARPRRRAQRDLDARFDIELGERQRLAARSHGPRRTARTSRRGGHAPELEIELPPRATLVVETVSAEIEVEGLIGDQRYRTTSGDITLRVGQRRPGHRGRLGRPRHPRDRRGRRSPRGPCRATSSCAPARSGRST